MVINQLVTPEWNKKQNWNVIYIYIPSAELPLPICRTFWGSKSMQKWSKQIAPKV